MCVVSIRPGDVVPGAAGWAAAHPGVAALLATVLTYGGVAAVVLGAGARLAEQAAGHGTPVWAAPLALAGGSLYVVALPAALGLAGTCCATQRELVRGLAGGVAAALLALVAVVLVAPVRAL